MVRVQNQVNSEFCMHALQTIIEKGKILLEIKSNSSYSISITSKIVHMIWIKKLYFSFSNNLLVLINLEIKNTDLVENKRTSNT